MSKRAGSVNARKCREWRAKNPEKTIHSRTKTRAAKAGVLFALTFDDITIPEKCPACGVVMEVGRLHGIKNSPSLDRIVPELGYIAENCVVVCFECNRLKNDCTPERLYRVADYFYRLRKVRGLCAEES